MSSNVLGIKDKTKTSKNEKVLEPLHLASSKRFDMGCIESFEDGLRSCFPGLPLEFSLSCRSSNTSERALLSERATN